MADGHRGLLAPWIGGAGSPGSTGTGYRSLLAFWSGGAANSGVAATGYTGMLAFWSGGAANSGVAPPAPRRRRPTGIFLFGQLGNRDPRY